MSRRSRQSRLRPPENMAEALQAAFAELGLTDQARRLEISRAWRNAVGPQIAARSQPDTFRRGTLLVTASSAAWQNELVFLRAEIIAKLNAALGSKMVRDIKVVTGRVHEVRGEQPPAWTKAAPVPEDLDFAKRVASSIEDPELRGRVERTVEKALRHDRHAGRKR